MGKEKYRLIGKYMQWCNIIGFCVEVISSKEKKQVSKEDTIKLIKSGVVEECTILRDGETEYIKYRNTGVHILPTLQAGEKLSIVERFIDEGTRDAVYIAESEKGTRYKVKPAVAWKMAQAGKITNIIATYSCNKKIVKGKEINLGDLKKNKI